MVTWWRRRWPLAKQGKGKNKFVQNQRELNKITKAAMIKASLTIDVMTAEIDQLRMSLVGERAQVLFYLDVASRPRLMNSPTPLFFDQEDSIKEQYIKNAIIDLKGEDGKTLNPEKQIVLPPGSSIQ